MVLSSTFLTPVSGNILCAQDGEQTAPRGTDVPRLMYAAAQGGMAQKESAAG